MAGGTGAAVTVNVTGTVTGVTPVPLSVTVPLVEPTGKVPCGRQRYAAIAGAAGG